ncbi:MAG: hypothetical protein NTW52_02310 [Planctomycetota bacterium]|nr:hypothetical protein [Planctomycetota bacterium]
MRHLPILLLAFLLAIAAGLSLSSDGLAAQKGNPAKAAKERKDDAKVQNERQDINEAEKKIQASLKELRTAELEAKKSAEAFTTSSKAKNETTNRLEKTLGEKLGLPKATEAQRVAQLAYDEATKPWLEAMKQAPKYSSEIEKAARAASTLKSIAAESQPDESSRKQQAQAAIDMAQWRSTVSSYLESVSELNPAREKLAAAQNKLVDLRLRLKQQVESHPDLKASERERIQAKEANEKDELRVATLRRKAVSEQGKLLAEKSQLAKAIAQDKQNDSKNNNNKNSNQKKNDKK